MAFYESVVIARPELTESQIENLINSLSKIISDEKGKVVKKENWGLRSLAYRIKKNKKGHYFMLNLDSDPSTIFEYERKMRIRLGAAEGRNERNGGTEERTNERTNE